MKKMIGLTLVSLISLSAFAFNINLANKGQMSVDDIVNSGATAVSCESTFPKCILMPERVGIQYEGQELKDVEFLYYTAHVLAVSTVKQYKKDGICK